MSLKKELIFRKLIDSISNTKVFKIDNIDVYLGIDLTGRHLHIGHLLPIMIMYWFIKYGHKTTIILGGITTLIRDLKINFNKKILKKIPNSITIKLNKLLLKTIILKLKLIKKTKILDNSDWLCRINYIEFLTNIGKNIVINKILTHRYFKSKIDLNQSIYLSEFMYITLQSIDFIILAKKLNNNIIQIGGSDQWINMLSGIELGKKLGFKNLNALTCKLLLIKEKKIGKSLNHDIPICIGKNCLLKLWIFLIKITNINFYLLRLINLNKIEFYFIKEKNNSIKKKIFILELLIILFGIKYVKKFKNLLKFKEKIFNIKELKINILF